jgi:hypothetical protein
MYKNYKYKYYKLTSKADRLGFDLPVVFVDKTKCGSMFVVRMTGRDREQKNLCGMLSYTMYDIL